jgi:hypothetical protein
MQHAMTNVIKPYTILGVQQYPDGQMIAYEVKQRNLVEESRQLTRVLRTTAFAPLDADVDAFMVQHLKESGWIA